MLISAWQHRLKRGHTRWEANHSSVSRLNCGYEFSLHHSSPCCALINDTTVAEVLSRRSVPLTTKSANARVG